MNILGLHFGHDAAVSILRDGLIAAYVMRERHSRIKHAISLEFKNIQTAMDEAKLRWDEIDYCAITSTQRMELIIDDPSGFSVSMTTHPQHQAPCMMADLVNAQNLDPAGLLVHKLMDFLYDPAYAGSYIQRHYGHAFPEYRSRRRDEITRFGTMDGYVNSSLWQGGTLNHIASSDFSDLLRDGSARYGFHYPVTVRLAGHTVPGYFIAHHMAHAASSFYQSGFDRAAILTHDGGGAGPGYLNGMFLWGEGHRIHPITPHHLAIGYLYEEVGVRLGMGDVGPPGKLMGLAGYGQPRFYDRRFVGNLHDWQQAGVNPNMWIQHCLTQAQEMNYDVKPFGDPTRSRAPINVDIAASTQKVFEETYLMGVDALAKVLGRVGLHTDNLCLSGGSALNCPSNSRVFREGRFRNVFVEPGCDDSGLAIGAASFLYHNVLDQLLPARVPEFRASAYLGVGVSAGEIRAVLEEAGHAIQFTDCEDAAAAAAEDLAMDRVIGWFEGPSEILGLRALGHRSILGLTLVLSQTGPA